MLTTQRKLFVPNAVFIPTKDGKEGKDFDRTDCTLLMVDGEYAYGEVYTEEAWQNTVNRAISSEGAISSCPTNQRYPTGQGATAARYAASSRYRTESIGAKRFRTHEAESSPFTPWTDASTSISAKCVPPTSFISSNISTSHGRGGPR